MKNINKPTLTANQLIQRLVTEITIDEGIRDDWYLDTEGHETIGIGFTKNAFTNLSDDGYRVILGVIVRERLIQIHQLSAFKWFERMPMTIQAVVFNMVYQLGTKGFLQFKKTINHLKNKRWKMASKEMLNSKWARQTPNRAKKMSEWVTSVANEGKPKIHRVNKITDSRGKLLFDPNVDELSDVETIPINKKIL